jgi:predicted methyltransferase
VYAIVPAKAAQDQPSLAAEVKTELAAYQNVEVIVQSFDGFKAPEPLDVVWMGKIYHDLPNVAEMGHVDIAAMNTAIFTALKPGGRYIIVEHSAVPGSGFLDTEADMSKRLHRIDPDMVKSQVLAAGFVLEAESKVLANPSDPHTKSVFDPSITGRTDRFVFKFRKPGR